MTISSERKVGNLDIYNRGTGIVDMYPKTPKRVHVVADMYPKTPKRVHVVCDMYPKTPKRVHVVADMY